MAPSPRWWEFRPAQNRKPATYRCPLCGEYLPSLSEHTLLFPEGDHTRRRHAHTACVLREREAGRLLTREELQRREAIARAEVRPASDQPRAAILGAGLRPGRERRSGKRWTLPARLRRKRTPDS